MTAGITADIDLSAIYDNLKCLKQRAPRSRVLAMVKANAYGHGLGVLDALREADMFGVATLQEAQAIRDKGIMQAVLVMQGFFSADDLCMMHDLDLHSVIHSDWQITLLEKTGFPKGLRVWLELDTGMGRLGFTPNDFASALQRLEKLDSVKEITLMSHFACADEASHPNNEKQLTCFNELTKPFSYPKSMAASAAIFNFPESHFDWIRPGLSLYGISPFAGGSALALGLRPAMTLSSRILSIKTLPAGHPIGYGSTFICTHETRVGIIAMGYADGYPREAGGLTTVSVDGKIVQFIGRLSMDLFALDLTDCAHAKAQASVILWGPSHPIEVLAQAIGTIPYTLLVRLGSRVHYCYS